MGVDFSTIYQRDMSGAVLAWTDLTNATLTQVDLSDADLRGHSLVRMEQAHLPVFFRTISGPKPSREDLEKLVELIRSANRP